MLAAMRARGLLAWLTIWSVAFGVLEGAVVVYLRRIFYPGSPPDASLFPLRDMGSSLVLVEVAREAATLLMLLGVAMLAERRPLRRFAAFAFCFGVWDLVYYVMLRVAIGVWLVRIPLCYVFVALLGLGASSVWWAMNVSQFVQAALLTSRYLGKEWLKR